MVNFHSDLQRPFLKIHQALIIFLLRSFESSTDQSLLMKNVEVPVEKEGEKWPRYVSLIFEFRAFVPNKPLWDNCN